MNDAVGLEPALPWQPRLWRRGGHGHLVRERDRFEALHLDSADKLLAVVHVHAPAEIVRDPLYTMPLAHDARFQALAARLEEQMRATAIR